MWGRPENHSPAGANVLYMDGHVEFVEYPSEFPMTERFMERLEEISARKATQ
jgi:prepilin-type processing-associated H-X9-DG protein